ncbi:MAG: copper-binding protein [Holophaga sp.]|nr:copper-binding protein [Holophaga sp.]
MKRIDSLLLPAILMLSVNPAHAAGRMVMGTVKAIDSARIVLTLKDGKDRAIPLGKDTMFMRGNDMVGADQVKPGMQVTVELEKDNKTAGNVMLPK